MDTLALDDKTCRYFERHLAQMRALEAALNGALALLIEQNELQGRWQLDLANKQLVKSADQRTDAELKAA